MFDNCVFIVYSIEGIVVAEENEGMIFEAWEEEEQVRVERANKVSFNCHM